MAFRNRPHQGSLAAAGLPRIRIGYGVDLRQYIDHLSEELNITPNMQQERDTYAQRAERNVTVSQHRVVELAEIERRAELGAGQPGRGAGDLSQNDVGGERQSAGMDAQDLAAAGLVGNADDDLAVEPARAAERFVERLRPVGRGDHHQILARLDPVEQAEQLRDQPLFGLAGDLLEHLAEPLGPEDPGDAGQRLAHHRGDGRGPDGGLVDGVGERQPFGLAPRHEPDQAEGLAGRGGL